MGSTPSIEPVAEAATESPDDGEVMSEIAMVLVVHLAVALAAAWLIAGLGIG